MRSSKRCRGAPARVVWVRLLGKLFINPINIPLRRFAFATRRCPPSKRDVGLAKAIGADMAFKPHRHPPAAALSSKEEFPISPPYPM